MPKLRLKRTPEEEAARQLRKKQKEAKSKRKHGLPRQENDTSRPWAPSDDEPQVDDDREPDPSYTKFHLSDSTTTDYEKLRAELEEKRFRERMFEAFEDDERLDSLEARFNDFAHVPERWRTGGASKRGKAVYDDDVGADDLLNVDPQYMGDEEYAEWIRMGMYRKTHAQEYAEQQRKKAMKTQRREEERARKVETQRLEKVAEEERRRKKLERMDRKRQYAWEEYEIQWKALLSCRGKDDANDSISELGFSDIPWPVLAAHRQRPDKGGTPAGHISVALEHLSKDAILDFLIPPIATTDPVHQKVEKKERKDKLRETFLRFHPDKFEGRFMELIKESERDAVREAIGQVVRSLNTLMSETT